MNAGPCPVCGGTRTWTEKILVPMASDTPPYPTIDGTKHCADCENPPPWAYPRRLLSFQELADTNRSRAQRWHPGFPHAGADWTGADWSNAMCGEAGETANVVKKLRRYECGLKGELDPPEDELRAALADEIADVICYADLLATYYGIDLAEAVARKFNIVSERQGFPERLP